MTTRALCHAFSSLNIYNIWGNHRPPVTDVHPLDRPFVIVPKMDFERTNLATAEFFPSDAQSFWAGMEERRKDYANDPRFFTKPIFKRARDFHFEGQAKKNYGEMDWMYGYIGHQSQGERIVRVAIAAFFVLDEGSFFMTEEAADYFNVVLGEPMTVSPLFVAEPPKAPSESRDVSTGILCLKSPHPA